jgi:hypothetical protein
VSEEQELNMCTIWVTLEVSNGGTDSSEEQDENIVFIFVALDVSSSGTLTRDAHPANALVKFSTFEVSNDSKVLNPDIFWKIASIPVVAGVSSILTGRVPTFSGTPSHTLLFLGGPAGTHPSGIFTLMPALNVVILDSCVCP